MRALILLCLFCNLIETKVLLKTDSMVMEKSITSWAEIRDTNLTKQKYDYSCGAASLSTILTHYYGIRTDERSILESILESKGIAVDRKEEIEWNDDLREKASTSFLDLAHFAERNNIKAVGLALDIEALGKLKMPVIIYVKARNNDHFSVYRGMDTHFVYLSDPSFGNIRISRAKFQEMFYQRKNTKQPGKILALIPQSTDIQPNIEFMQKQHNAVFLEEVIRSKSVL